MRTDRTKALELRLAGKSYGEIQKALGIPKSTLSGWFSRLELSEKTKEKILKRTNEKSLKNLIKRNKEQTILAIKRKIEIQKEAAKEIEKITKQNLLLIGAILYWAEGYKRPILKNGREVTHHPISLTNSDPKLVKLFLKFIRETCKIPNDKIKADLRLFKHIDENLAINYWTKITQIDVKKFGKVYYGISRSSLGKKPFNRLPYGIIQIRISDTNQFHRIMGWIEKIKKLV